MYRWIPHPLLPSKRRSQISLLLILTPFYCLLFLLHHLWDCCGYSEIPSSFALFSLMISPKDLPSLCFWVTSPISNPYLCSPCLNTHHHLSLVLLLLKPNKTLQHALEGFSTASGKSISTLSCLSKSEAKFHSFQSCSLVSKFCL